MTLPEPLDVLAVAPHPDDLEITCGGTLAKLVRQGKRVGIVDLTTGEPTPRGSLEIRAREAEAARVELGVPVRVNLQLPNRELFDNAANRAALATVFRTWRPRVVLGTFGRTPAASPDHYQGQLLIESSRFWSQLTKWDERFGGTSPWRVPHLVYALFPFDAEQRVFHSQFVVDITDTFETKMRSIACYESQFDAARFDKLRHFAGAFNATQGARCGFTYGELFALPTPVGTGDFFAVATGAQGSAVPVQLPGKDHLPMG
ncbi:MAG: PIG-L family deacetylase [Gemmataceae bacterium]|nr:PIG-L family deacetylase [Gemmataceae bacterium]